MGIADFLDPQGQSDPNAPNQEQSVMPQSSGVANYTSAPSVGPGDPNFIGPPAGPPPVPIFSSPPAVVPPTAAMQQQLFPAQPLPPRPITWNSTSSDAMNAFTPSNPFRTAKFLVDAVTGAKVLMGAEVPTTTAENPIPGQRGIPKPPGPREFNDVPGTQAPVTPRPISAPGMAIPSTLKEQKAFEEAQRTQAESDASNALGIAGLKQNLGQMRDADAAAKSERADQEFQSNQAQIDAIKKMQETAANYKIDPGRYMKNQSFFQKGLLGFAAGLVGVGNGLQGKSGNEVVENFNRDVDRDIDAQKNEQEQLEKKGINATSLYSMHLKALGDKDAAKDASRADIYQANADYIEAQRYTGLSQSTLHAMDTKIASDRFEAAKSRQKAAEGAAAYAASHAREDAKEQRDIAAKLAEKTGTVGEAVQAAAAIRTGDPNSKIAIAGAGGKVSPRIAGKLADLDSSIGLLKQWEEMHEKGGMSITPSKRAAGDILTEKIFKLTGQKIANPNSIQLSKADFNAARQLKFQTIGERSDLEVRSKNTGGVTESEGSK